MQTRIAIADDHLQLTNAIIEKLDFCSDFKVKFTAIHGQNLLDKLNVDANIDLILMDVEMPIMDGVKATESVKNKYPHIKILILTVMDNDEHIFNAIKAGADGYLLKDTNAEDLCKAINEVLSGGAAMSPTIAYKTLKLLRNPIDTSAEILEKNRLSERETEVLVQLSKGLNYNKIAQNLFLSPSTVRKHIENIYAKLHVHNKLEAVQKAKNSRII